MFRVGIVGFGNRAKAHAKNVQSIEDAELVAVAEIDDARRSQAEEQFGVKGYADVNEMVSREKLDVVIVSTPSFVHREGTVAAARAGAHVLCEKPIALSLEDADAMIEECERAGVKLMVGFSTPFEPRHRTLLEIFRSGKLGELVYCWSKQCGFFSLKGWEQRRKEKSWRMSQELSGGRVMEMSSHEMCWLTSVGGRVHSVHSGTATFTPDVETDELNVSLLKFAQGFGFLEMNKSPTAVVESSLGIAGRRGTVACVQGKIRLRMLGDEEETQVEVQPCESLHEHFFRCLREGVDPQPDGRHARRVLAACLGILESAKTGKPVDIPE